MFPFEDEFTIKWVYYQYMNFNLSYRYLYKKNNKKVNYGLHAIIDNNDQPPSLSSSSSSYQQPQHQMNNTNNNNNTHHNKILYRIINENPSQWKFANDNASINIREYQCIRHRLIREAQKAHAMKKHTQANAIMAKANRYKQEINNLIEKQKLNEFFKNNYDVNINDISPNILDLHGMSLDESKLILKHKLTHLQKQKQLNDITQTTTLTIITGKGNHSYQNIPILFPGIVKYLSANTNFKFKSNESQGVIKVYI
jgi:DNA-nicking Smr family endonuclease